MPLRALTGIKPTGEPHLGNWLGAIKPALALAGDYETFYFIADYHALTAIHNAEELRLNSLAIAATYLAFGLNPAQSFFYRQSDIPEIFELAWILSCFTAKGLMNRAHSYKDAVAKNLDQAKDPDFNINMGRFGYPVLMAADILIFQADVVPVGMDQKQHVEIACDIAAHFNHTYQAKVFTLPEARIDTQVKTILGLDGQKMSKSYGNTLPLFMDEKSLRKRVNQVVTNSQSPEEPKQPDESTVFALHKLLLNPGEEAALRERYLAGGLGWGKAKQDLFESLNAQLQGPRAEYQRWMNDPESLNQVLAQGRDKARTRAADFLTRVRATIGIR